MHQPVGDGAAQPYGAPGAAPAVVRASAGSNALWVRVAEGGGAEDAVRAGVVDAVRRLLPALSMDVRADLQARVQLSCIRIRPRLSCPTDAPVR